MIVYNITTKVSPAIAQQWLEWMQMIHLPEINNTGCFTEHKLFKLLEDETEGTTYVLQLMAESMADYNRYTSLYAPGLKARSFEKWGDGFIAFRSVMQTVY